MLKKFNPDWEKRNSLINPYAKADIIGQDLDHIRFEELPVDVLKELVKLKLADPEETQNESPTIAEFIEYMEKYSSAKAHGYIISFARDDYRVSVEGITQQATRCDLETRKEFFKFFRYADELDPFSEIMRCWYD